MNTTLPENFKMVYGALITTNAAVTGDYVSLKNAHRAWVIFLLDQATGHATTCSVMRATGVGPVGDTAMTETARIWANEDAGTSDTLVQQADAADFAVDNSISDKMVVIEVVPQKLTATFDCIAGKTSASSQAGNHVSIMYLLETRYPSATPPTAITD